MKKYLLSALLFIPSFAWAVCNPFVPNTVLTASALNTAISSPCITSGTINGAIIGGTTPMAGAFSTLSASVANPSLLYQSSAASSVARTYQSKMGDVVSVLDFSGCDPTGVADSTTCINTALTNSVGKKIYFPAGTYKYSGGGVLGNGTVIFGAGRNATIFLASTATGTLFTVSGYGAGIEHVSFAAGVTQTAGSYVVLSGVESYITDFEMTGDFNGILMTGNVSRIIHGRFGSGASGSIRIRAEGGDNSQVIDDVLMGAQLPQIAAAGIRVRNSSALIISNTSVINQTIGLLIDPYTVTPSAATDAGGVYSLYVHDCFFDTNATNGIRIAPTGTGPVVRSRFEHVWASSSGADGVYVVNGGTGAVNGIHFTTPHLLLNTGAGITVGGTVGDVSIVGGEIGQNAYGVYLNTGLTGFKLLGATVGIGAGVNANTNQGLLISAGVADIVVADNDMRGNSAAISDLGGTTEYIHNNIGSTITTGAVFNGVYGGTFVDGVAVTYTTGNGQISVGAGDTLSLYTGGIASSLMAQFSSTGMNSTAVGATTASTGAFTTLSASGTVSGTGFSTYLASPPAIGGTAPAAGGFTTLTITSDLTRATGRAVQNTAAQATATIAAGIASTYIATPAATITITLAAPTGDGERRRVCVGAATTATWNVTAPATTTAGLPTSLIAGQCVEAVYNSVAGTPTNSTATTWYVY